MSAAEATRELMKLSWGTQDWARALKVDQKTAHACRTPEEDCLDKDKPDWTRDSQSSARKAAGHAVLSWSKVDRVVSNRFVSTGPAYPSKAKPGLKF